MTKISAEVVADSLSPQGDRLTSLLITFPRMILAEVNTHRMLSKNTASSRAIPFKKMVESVQNDPFIPIAWQMDHRGMQGNVYNTDIFPLKETWLEARDQAIGHADYLNSITGITKQLCNRLLEPFMWTTMLITGSKEGWENFFELRCPQYEYEEDLEGYGENPILYFKSKKECIEKYERDIAHSIAGTTISDLNWLKRNRGQAEIHMMALAEAIYDARNESTPIQLQAGEWHIPFEDKINISSDEYYEINPVDTGCQALLNNRYVDFKIKVSTAMAARTSYTIVGDEKEINYENLIALHDRLIIQNPLHASPMEHCARSMSEREYDYYTKTTLSSSWNEDRTREIPAMSVKKGWCRNYKGFIQYRHILETQF